MTSTHRAAVAPSGAGVRGRRPRWLTGAFARHYAEMVIVMLVGMGVLAVPARRLTDALWPDVDGNDTRLMLARMAATMTLPMIGWMRWRRHGWRPCLEMAAAMLAPAGGAVALLETGVVEPVWALMTIEHAAMFGAMFVLMAARPDEYAHARHSSDAAAATRTSTKEQRPMSTSITREELRAAIDHGSVTVVDGLPPAPFAKRHLPGALNVVVEHTDEQVRAALPDRDALIVTYSTDSHCTRGREIAARLRELGYRHVRTYHGGIEDWIAAGLPIEPAQTDSGHDAEGSDAESSSAGALPPAPVRVTPLPDGPYQVTGPLEITRPDGVSIPAPETVYLCRCGSSANKPFCDGSHARTGWVEHA